MTVNSYRDLKVCQKAMDLVVTSYALTKRFPQTEIYSLTNQIQRALFPYRPISPKDRVASTWEITSIISVANGSLMELETHFLLAGRLNYLSNDELTGILGQTEEVGRMLAGLIRSLKKSRSDT
jgi:four helix bundle protein